MPRKYFRKFLPSHAAIRQHRHLARFGPWLQHHNLWHLHRRSVAGGLAIGMFAGLMPGSNPVQFTVAAILAIVFRVNLPIAVIVTLYSNPFTIVPLYYAAFKLGQLVLMHGNDGLPPVAFSLEGKGFREWIPAALEWLTQHRQAAADRIAAAGRAARDGRLFRGRLGMETACALRMATAQTPPRATGGKPMTTPHYWKNATRELAARDAVLKKLVAKFKGLTLGSRGDAFSTLARAIVGQQISVKAAQSVWDRLTAEVQTVTPAAVHGADSQRLRACGLSNRKVGYLQDLARAFIPARSTPACGCNWTMKA